jgi:hypothetical protein
MQRSLHLLMLLAAALCLTVPAHGAPPVTTSLQVPLDGTVFVPLNNGVDTVALTGYVHVVTHVPALPSDPIRIHVNLDQVAGVGEVTGLLYVATGANRINFPSFPTDPINLGFDLRAVRAPSDPITPPDPVVPLDISLRLSFNEDTGALSEVSIVSVSVPET